MNKKGEFEEIKMLRGGEEKSKINTQRNLRLNRLKNKLESRRKSK